MILPVSLQYGVDHNDDDDDDDDDDDYREKEDIEKWEEIKEKEEEKGKELRRRAQRTVHVLHNSEQPASVFSILESGTKTIPLVADGLFDMLMLKMTSIYTSKKQTRIEARGPRFEIGDFCVKLGSVTMSQNFKGVLVEVGFEPEPARFTVRQVNRYFTAVNRRIFMNESTEYYIYNRQTFMS
ncbi:hypothetical protein ANN_10082 [Periplaneta americana]|uniref:Mediator of RNA polymerase II transcription subunit 20 n=1 Tax=Periplaneta americana TaxID=6978 RepID=A0ABQ8TQR4_PERAM|nr:hypothetical protein ANN_10082 [Periplaneta americana]